MNGYTVTGPFVQAEVVVLLPKDHALSARASLTFDDLAHDSLIGPKADYGPLSMLLWSPQGVFPRLRHEVSTPDTIFAMVRERMGIALVLKMQVDPEAQGLIALPLNPHFSVNIHLAAQTRSPAIEAFMDSASTWAKTHGFMSDPL